MLGFILQPNLREKDLSVNQLEDLDLRGNLVPIPSEILGTYKGWYEDPGDLQAILSFYFQRDIY